MRNARRRTAWRGAGALFFLAVAVGSAAGARQGAPAAGDWRARASHVIVPQARAFSWQPEREGIAIELVRARVEIAAGVASTTLELFLRNPSARAAEAILVLPVPRASAVSAFAFDGDAPEPSAVLLPRGEARRIYDEIVARLRDPALLEFAGHDLVRSSVFPVPAGGAQRVRLTYEHVLEVDGDRTDYVLPRSESLASAVPWEISVGIRSAAPISAVYSPSHRLVTERRGPGDLALQLEGGRSSDPGPFRLSYLRERDAVSASLIAYPDPKVGGGFFLLLAGLPASVEAKRESVPREVTIVLDRSGSMAGEKMEQARAAALQIVEGLADGELFNVIDYAGEVARFAPAPVTKDERTIREARQYLAGLRASGGTNLHDALLEALRQEHRPGSLPLVLFLTDGLATVGRTSEAEIREMAARANEHGRRIFTFGVGHDVNVPLLDRIADDTRAVATYVLPGEDVELKVAQVFRRLAGPVLADLELESLDAEGQVTTRAVRELMPARLPDLFEGDQLAVLGQYTGAGPLAFRLSGLLHGSAKSFELRFELSRASVQNAYVPRLWAARKIAFLVDEIRQAGAQASVAPMLAGSSIFDEPRHRELAEEILRLSTRYGILSEYTAFLATEGTDLCDWNELTLACNANLDQRAVRTRTGEGAVNQGLNFNAQKLQGQLNYSNASWNEKNEWVELTGVQQLCDRAFYKRGARWIDSALVGGEDAAEEAELVLFGSERHREMLERLAADGRQGLLSLPGEILLEYEGQRVLVQNDAVQAGRPQ